MRKSHVTWAGICLLLLGAVALGCKSKPSEQPTEFVGEEQAFEQESDLYPLHRVWFDESWNDPAIRSLVVAPVNTEFVKNSTWWNKATAKGHDLEDDLAKAGLYTQERFQKAFREDKNQRFQVVDQPRDDSYILELAIVELIPNKAELGALGLAASVVAAPVGAGVAAKETAKGKVAIEGRWRRASDRYIVAEFTDREHGKFGPINLRRATWYGHAKLIVNEWADQWVQIVNAEPGQKVKDTRTWTLMPW